MNQSPRCTQSPHPPSQNSNWHAPTIQPFITSAYVLESFFGHGRLVFGERNPHTQDAWAIDHSIAQARLQLVFFAKLGVMRRGYRAPSLFTNFRSRCFELSAHATGRESRAFLGAFGTFTQTLASFFSRTWRVEHSDTHTGQHPHPDPQGHRPKPTRTSISIRQCSGQATKKQFLVHRWSSPWAMDVNALKFASGHVTTHALAVRMPRRMGTTCASGRRSRAALGKDKRRGLAGNYLQKPSMHTRPAGQFKPAVGSHSLPRLLLEPQT